MEPIKTSFSFSTTHHGPYDPCLFIEPCGHIPSLGELTTAPFYPDHSQRILAMHIGFASYYVINVEQLLKLAHEREGQHVGWDEWGAYMVEVGKGLGCHLGLIWVSGCRLFYIVSDPTYGDPPCYLQVHDFSPIGRSKHLCTQDGASKGERVRQFSLSSDGYKLPWSYHDSWPMHIAIGHDSLIFHTVSIPIFLLTAE